MFKVLVQTVCESLSRFAVHILRTVARLTGYFGGFV